MSVTDTHEIRKALMAIKGERVKLFARGERNRIIRATGILDGVYPAIFTVAVCTDGQFHKFSYTYNEVVTKNVSVKLID